jgi:hypothetical protein
MEILDILNDLLAKFSAQISSEQDLFNNTIQWLLELLKSNRSAIRKRAIGCLAVAVAVINNKEAFETFIQKNILPWFVAKNAGHEFTQTILMALSQIT